MNVYSTRRQLKFSYLLEADHLKELFVNKTDSATIKIAMKV